MGNSSSARLSGLRPLGRLLTASTKLKGLLDQLSQLEMLTAQVRQLLPIELAPHLVQARFKGEQLVLIASSSAWASRLRFATANLRNEFPAVKNIRVAVLPANQTAVTTVPASAQAPKAARTMSLQNAKQLRSVAADISDLELKAILLRLAKRAR